jgi:MFS family permease
MQAGDSENASWGELLAQGRWPKFALILLGVWLVAADALVTATVMPSVGADLGGYGLFGWVVAGYMLGAIVAGASAGWLSQRIGLRPALIVGAATYAAGCALGAAAPDIGWFIAGRVAQGVGGGWIGGLCYVAIGVMFAPRHLARMFAASTAVWGPATLLGPLVGGLFATAGDWRGAFWMFSGQAVVFGLAALALLPKVPREPETGSVPWRQLALITLAIAAIGVADLAGNAWASSGLVALGLGVLVWMVRLDARAEARLLPRRSGDLTSACGAGYLTIFALTAASMGLAVYGAAILQSLYGLSPLSAGYVICADAAGWTTAGLLVAGAREAWHGRFIRLGGAVVVAGVVLLGFTLPAGPLWAVVAAATLMGVGFGLCWAFISRRILGGLADDERAIGSSAIAAVQQTGAAAGAAIMGVVANLLGFSTGLSVESASAVALWVFAIGAPIALLGAWSAWRLAKAEG